MPKENYNHYKEQLNRITPGSTKYAPTIRVFANGNGEDTKHISLNKESAKDQVIRQIPEYKICKWSEPITK